MDPVFQISIVAAFSLLFALAALEKLRRPAHFRQVLTAYQIMPETLVLLVGFTVIGSEALVAVAVWIEPLRAIALWTMAGLLSAYWLAMAINLARGRRDIDCGCSGPAARQSLSPGLLLRNAVLIALAVGAAVADDKQRPLLWLDWFSIAAGVAVCALLYAAANRLLAQAPRLAMLRGG